MTGRQRVCVIGSGIAGLMAARVLADHFGEVVVCERDPAPDRNTARSGVPQGAHIHALIRRGEMAVETLFPGLAEELIAEGAIRTGDIGGHMRIFMRGTWGVECAAGFTGLQFTRPLFEHCVRRRVGSLPNVAIRYSAKVADLITNSRGTRVTGVRLCKTGGGVGEAISADLVIDTSGRGAVSMETLKDRAVSLPREDLVPLDFDCTSAMFEIPHGFKADWSSLVIGAGPPNSRLAILQVVEGGRWLVSFAASGAYRPEPTEESFRAFAKHFPSNLIDDLVSRARLLGPVKRYRFAASLHRRFDLLEAPPEGFLALGDAVCTLNPIYGQGMSLAALEVEALAACLSARSGEVLEELWRQIYPQIVDAIVGPWHRALTLDVHHETTRIQRPRGFLFHRPLLHWAQKLSQRDRALRETLLRIVNLVPGPGDSLSLLVLAKAQARVWLSGARGGVAPTYKFTT